MKLVDVNVLVNGFRPDTAGHVAAQKAMAEAQRSREPLVILPEVAVGFVRVVTHPRIFAEPNTSAEALNALDAWCSAPSVRVQEAGRGRWGEFRRLMSEHQVTGNDVHDLLLAAAALDLSAGLLTHDRGFTRFDGLRVELI